MAHSAPPGDAIFAVVCASLKLASSSTEQLTIDQLRALKFDLKVTLAVIRGQIKSEESGMFTQYIFEYFETHSCFTDDKRVRIDLVGVDSESDEEEEPPSTTNGTYQTPPDLRPPAHGDHR